MHSVIRIGKWYSKFVRVIIINSYEDTAEGKVYITFNNSKRGIKKARVFPLPVTASTATSRPCKKYGMQTA